MPKKVVDERDPIDIAYDLLRQSGAPMVARALLTEAVGAAGQDATDGELLAELQTEISLDHRFQPASQGSWGLYEWAPKPKSGRSGGRTGGTRKRSAPPAAEDGSATSDGE